MRVIEALMEGGDLQLKIKTLEALLIGFKEPIKYDFCVPSREVIQDSFKFAIEKSFAGKYKHIRQDDYHKYYFFNGPMLEYTLKPIKELEGRVKEGLIQSLGRPGETDYMGSYWGDSFIQKGYWKEKLEEAAFSDTGEVYKFREGERKRMEGRVKSYFQEEERKNFFKLHRHMREFVSIHYKLKGVKE